MMTPREYEEARAYLKAKLASPKEERDFVCSILTELEPVVLRRVVAASRRSPETLPDEILLLESGAVLRSRLCEGARS